MSVKEPWTHAVWKKKCREKIKSCDGLLILLSKNTWHAGGARWEVKCALEEGLPVTGMHIRGDDRGAVPPELEGQKVISWTWDNLHRCIKKL